MRDIWQTVYLDGVSVKHIAFGLLRILCILYRGVVDNKVTAQAAALSYYTLISLGPLVALMIMISGFILKGESQEFASSTLSRVMLFVAPSTEQFDEGNSGSTATQANPELVKMLEHLVTSAQSGVVGVVGSLVLVLISIQLITTIEKTLNSIWGVRRGRSLSQRILAYWTLISLGAIVSIACVSIFSASTLESMTSQVPFSSVLDRWLPDLGPIFSFAAVVCALVLFYKFIPNTVVLWKPALIGSGVVASLLWLNSHLSFLYVSNAIRTQSLYGSIGIIPILMFGLFVFWLIILLGGQIIYAIQNARMLTHLKAWENINYESRELLCLMVFVIVARRFSDCKKGPTVQQIAHKTQVPVSLINKSVEQLVRLSLISPVIEKQSDKRSMHYQPSRPLAKMSLKDFKLKYSGYGDISKVSFLKNMDPVVQGYLDSIHKCLDKGDMKLSIKEVIAKRDS